MRHNLYIMQYYTEINIHDYINMKIKRNAVAIEMFELQNKMLKKEILLNAGVIENNTQKISLLKEVCEIERGQLESFDQELENSTGVKYMAINNITPNKYEELKASILQDKEKILQLLDTIKNLSDNMPGVILTG